MAGQDYKKSLAPGGAQPVNIAGDYIYCKFADRPVFVVVDGSRVSMEAGDKYRPGAFKAFEIENPDTSNPLAVILTIGQGDYQRQIVKGEIQIEPGLRKADGSFVTDTRRELAVDLTPSNLLIIAYLSGQRIKQTAAADFITFSNKAANDNKVFEFDGFIVHAAIGEFTTDPGVENWYDTDLNLVLKTERSYKYTDGQVVARDIQQGSDAELYALRPVTGGVFVGNPGVERFIEPFAGDSKTFAATPNGLFFLTNDQRWAETDLIGNVIRQGVDLYAAGFEDNLCIRYNASKGRLVLMKEAGEVREFDYQTLATVRALDVTWDDGFGDYRLGEDGFVSIRDGVYGARRISNQSSMIWHALDDYQTKPEFRASRPGCGVVSALIRPDAIPQILAEVTVTETPSGAKLTGEIIRAAIEYYFKRQAPDDYLDHVYSLALSRDGDNRPFKTVSTGNESFDRANVADEFATILPGEIVITVDNELVLGGVL